MKKITHKALLLFVVIFCLISCYNNNDYNRATAAGKMIFDHTENTLQHYLKYFDIAINIDVYLKATEKEREDMEEGSLYGYRISENNTKDTIYVNRGDWVIARSANASLATPSTVWKITINDYPRVTKDGFFITTQSATNTWRIVVDNCNTDIDYYSMIETRTTIEMKKIANSGYGMGKYSMTTVDGTLNEIRRVIVDDINKTKYSPAEPPRDNDPFKVNYVITTAMKNYGMRFDEGALDMTVVRDVDSKTDNVKAEIIDNNRVLVKFKGLTEVWFSY